MKLLKNGVEASSLLSKILASTVLLQQIHGSGYFSLPDSLLLIQAEVSVSKPVLKINHSALWKLRRTKVEFLLFTPTVLSFWTVCGFNVADWEPLEFFDYLQWVRSKR